MAQKNKAEVLDTSGDLRGLWTIDGAKAREVYGNKRFWEGVSELVRLYSEIHAGDYLAAVEENTETKLNNHNQYGSNESKTVRHSLSIPYGLYLILTDYEPNFFKQKKKREEFMRRFPTLRACDTV